MSLKYNNENNTSKYKNTETTNNVCNYLKKYPS